MFLTDLLDNFLCQINHITNVSNNLLDLVFSNDPNNCNISRADAVTLPEDKFHPTLGLIYSLPSSSKSSRK